MAEKKLLIEGQEFYIDDDASLHGSWSYLYWKPGDSTACLDGDFTAEHLRAIADHMDKHKQ